MTYYATKAFAIGTGGLVTSYAIGDVVQPAHAMIAPAFCAPEGAVEAEPEKAEPKPAKATKKAAKKTGKKD